MAGSMSKVYGALAGILFIVSISILSLPFFFGITISSLSILLSSAMFEGGFFFLILRKCSDFPHYGYKITMNVITWFIVIYLILNLLIDYSSKINFPSEIGSIISDSFLLLPFIGLISSIFPFLYALSAGTPIRNKYASKALVMGSFTSLNFIPFMMSGLTLLNSFNTFFHEFIIIGIPLAIAQAVVNKEHFKGDLAKFVVLENLLISSIALNSTIMFAGSTSWYSLGFLIPLEDFFASVFILIALLFILLKFVKSLNSPYAIQKIAAAVPVTILSYLILTYFNFLPDVFILNSSNYSIFTGTTFFYDFLKALILMAVVIFIGRIITLRGSKSSTIMGFSMVVVLLGLFFAGYDSNRFQIPFIVGLGLSAAVITSADAISIIIKDRALPGYDLMKTSTSKPITSGQGSTGTPNGTYSSSASTQAVLSIPKRVPEMWLGRNVSGYTMQSIISKDTGFAFVMRGSRPNEPDVALKILKPYSSDGTKIAFDNEFIRKFLTEFQNVMVLNGKKYVVNIIGVSVKTYPDDNTKMAKYQENPPSIVMELLLGGKLSDLPFKYTTNDEMELFFEICMRVSQGLQDAHDQKVLHGDIKPDNIMFLSKNGMNIAKYSNSAADIANAIRKDLFIPKIVDFGSAKVRGFGDTVFSQFSVLYSPPEILLNNYDTDETYDVYEFGLVMYYMLAGCLNDYRLSKLYAKRQVFIESKVNTSRFYNDKNMLLNDVSLFPIEDLQGINQMVKKPLNYIIMRCIDIDPSKRYKDMRDVKNALIHCANKDYGYSRVSNA